MFSKKFKHLHDHKAGKVIREELLARALNNEEINIDQAVDEFWDPKDRVELGECRSQMEGYIASLRWQLKKNHNRYFASIDSHCTYSLIKNVNDHEVVAARHISKINSLKEINKMLANESNRLGIAAPSSKSLKFLEVSEENKLETNGKKNESNSKS